MKKKVKKYLQERTHKIANYIPPMLAKETEKPFNDKNWLYEIKWDGYRAIAELEGKNVKLYSRNGNSFNKSYPLLVDALSKMNVDAVLDGEIVVMDKDGIPSFQLLQDYTGDLPLIYHVFDLLYVDHKNICEYPLLQRKNWLKALLVNNDFIKYSDHVKTEGIEFYKLAIEQKLEGIMAKQMHSKYFPGIRTSNWLKIKHHKTMEAIIAGFTSPLGSRQHFGSLVLALRVGNKLKHIGQTGTGFNQKTLTKIMTLLKPLIIPRAAFLKANKPDIPYTPVKPILICEVKFTEITKEGKLRHPVFLHLRDDKKAKDII